MKFKKRKLFDLTIKSMQKSIKMDMEKDGIRKCLTTALFHRKLIDELKNRKLNNEFLDYAQEKMNFV